MVQPVQQRYNDFRIIISDLEFKEAIPNDYIDSIADLPPDEGMKAFYEGLKSFIRDHAQEVSILASLGGGILAALTINHIVVGLPVLALHSIALPALTGCLIMIGISQVISKNRLQGLMLSNDRLLYKIAPKWTARHTAQKSNLKYIKKYIKTTNKKIATIKTKLNKGSYKNSEYMPYEYEEYKCLSERLATLMRHNGDWQKKKEKAESALKKANKNIDYIKNCIIERSEIFTANAPKSDSSSEGGHSGSVNTDGSIHSTHTLNNQGQDHLHRTTTFASSTSSIHSNHSDTSSTRQPAIDIANTPTNQTAADTWQHTMIPSLLEHDDESFITAPRSRINSETLSIDNDNTNPLEETTTDRQSIQTPVIGTSNNETVEQTIADTDIQNTDSNNKTFE